MVWSIFSSANDYYPVTIVKEDGFVDLSFKIHEVNDNVFVVKGKLSESKVGFGIELLPQWTPQQIEGLEEPIYWGEANFKSIGEETNNFVFELAKLYGVELKKIDTPSVILTQVVGLECNPQFILTTPCRMKFFFNPNGEEEFYSEIFVNIDVASNVLEFNEKDNDYRGPLLRSLLGEA